MVSLSARNIRICRPSKKLDYKFHGFYRILKCIETPECPLDLPEALKNIYDVFSVLFLEPHLTVTGSLI